MTASSPEEAAEIWAEDGDPASGYQILAGKHQVCVQEANRPESFRRYRIRGRVVRAEYTAEEALKLANHLRVNSHFLTEEPTDG